RGGLDRWRAGGTRIWPAGVWPDGGLRRRLVAAAGSWLPGRQRRFALHADLVGAARPGADAAAGFISLAHLQRRQCDHAAAVFCIERGNVLPAVRSDRYPGLLGRRRGRGVPAADADHGRTVALVGRPERALWLA